MHKETYSILYGDGITENIEMQNYFEIDDMIAPIISALNRKGYLTTHCCSGHNIDGHTNTYITFREEATPRALPPNFILEDEKYYKDHYHPFVKPKGLCIRKSYEYKGDKLNDIIQTVISLKEWVELLELKEEHTYGKEIR